MSPKVKVKLKVYEVRFRRNSGDLEEVWKVVETEAQGTTEATWLETNGFWFEDGQRMDSPFLVVSVIQVAA